MNENEIAVVEETAAISHVNQLELVDVEYAAAAQQNFVDLVEALLDEDSDYQGGKKKKSAWRKLARAFNISDEPVTKEIIRDDNYQIISAYFEVKAVMPNGRYGFGIGDCSIFDKVKASDNEMPSNFELRKRFTNAEHDVIATAHTRAKSRAIADLIGAGETSAEELYEPKQVSRTHKNSDNGQANDSGQTKRKGRGRKKRSAPKMDGNEIIDTKKVDDDAEDNSSSSNSIDFDKLAEENEAFKTALNRLKDGGDEVTKQSMIDELYGLYDLGTITMKEYYAAKELLDI